MDNNGSVLDIFQNLVGNLEAAVEDLASEKSDDSNDDAQTQQPAKAPLAGKASSNPKAAPECIVEGGSKRTSKSSKDSEVIDIIDIEDDSEDEPVQKTETPAAPPASASASAGSSLNSSLKAATGSAEKSKESSPRSRKKYVPPRGRYSRTSPRDSDGGNVSSLQSLSSQMGSLTHETPSWQRYDRDELDKRKKCLVGQTVVGKLSPKRGNRYFIKWNVEPYDTIVISADKVEEVLGSTPPAGMWVTATIVGIGPSHVSWKKQHPYAMTLESRETRPSHQPSRGAMPPNAPYWKKTQRAGIVREVEEQEAYRTVPADFGMSRVKRSSGSRPGSANTSPNGSYRANRPQRSAVVPPFPPQRRSTSNHGSYTGGSAVITADDVIAEMQEEANKPKIYDLKVTQGANVNLVTGEIRQMGRSESHRSWRRGGGDPRDRGFTV